MARIDGYVRLVQKALPQSATPSVPVSDDHTDGTWTYRDIYDREIAINDDGNIYWRALDNIYEFTVASASGTNTYTTGATLSGSTGVFTRNDGVTYSLDLSTFGNTINYSTDLSGSYASHSLVDKSYVDTQVASVGASASANRFSLQVRNQTGATIYKGMVVYINGSTGNLPTIAKAQGNTESTSAGTFGIVLNDITHNSDGLIITAGSIDTLDTRTTATHPFTSDTLVDGQTLYLSPTTAGYITNIKPSAPNHLVYIGKVIRTSPTNGYIVYRIQNGYELDEIHDVAISGLTAGHILQYDGTLWRNATQSVPNLSEVLTVGNNTGNKDIELNNNSFTSDSDSIRAAGNTYDDARISYEDLGSGAWAPIMKVWNNDLKSHILVTESETQIWNSRVGGIYNHYSNFVQDWNSMSFNVADLTGGGGITMDIGTNTFNVYSSSLTFGGIKYGSDWSANFTARSLVDKAYVDGAIAGSGGTLQQTLALGNTTGTHSIYISSSASKIQGYNGVSQHWYDSTNPIFGDYFQIENGTGTSASFIKLFDDTSGAIHLANNNAWDLTSNDAFRTSIYMGGNTQILSENRDFAGNTFHIKTNTTVAPNGSTTETRDMINDTSAMVSTYTDGAGTQTHTLLQSYHNGGLKAGQIYVYNDKVNLRAEDNGVSFTNIELNYTNIIVSGTPSFGGIKYDRDYSTNYTNRSLVDKAYVDGLITTTPNLQTVLATGNSSGNNDIVFTNNYGLRNSGGEGKIIMTSFGTEIEHKIITGSNYKRGHIYASGDTGVVQITGDFQNTTGDTYGAGGAVGAPSYARLFYQETQLSTSNGYLTLVQTNKNNILVGSALNGTLANPNFVGLEYNHNYAANFTARSLVDKAYVDAAVAGGGGGGGGTFSGGTVSNATTFQSDVTFQANVIDENGTSIDMTNIINMTNLALMYNT